MHVLVCPDSFKGSLTAREAAEAIGTGVGRAFGDPATPVAITGHPISDGGEGFADLLTSAAGGDKHAHEIAGPTGAPITCHYGKAGNELILDAASVIGLPGIPLGSRDPTSLTSAPLGRLIATVMREHHGVTELTLGLGGTATMDLGLGALTELGVTLLDERGRTVRLEPPVYAAIERVEHLCIQPGTPADRLARGAPRLILAADTRTPLLGPAGASKRFGPQKGAAPSTVARFEHAFGRFVGLMPVSHRVGPNTAGAGAAGGVPLTFTNTLGATLEPGFGIFARRTSLASAIADADIIITGEGRFDMQSLDGKAVGSLIELAREFAPNAPVLVLAARVDKHAAAVLRGSGVVVGKAFAEGVGDNQGIANAAAFLEQAAAREMRTRIDADL